MEGYLGNVLLAGHVGLRGGDLLLQTDPLLRPVEHLRLLRLPLPVVLGLIHRGLLGFILLSLLLICLFFVLGGRDADRLQQRPGDGHLCHSPVPQDDVLHQLGGLDPQLRHAAPPLHHPLCAAHAPL